MHNNTGIIVVILLVSVGTFGCTGIQIIALSQPFGYNNPFNVVFFVAGELEHLLRATSYYSNGCEHNIKYTTQSLVPGVTGSRSM